MKIKKVILFVFAGICSFLILGCESTNNIRSAYFSDLSTPGSEKNVIKVVFEKDSRVDEKYVDIQIRSSKTSNVTFYEENKSPVTITFQDTKWNSLTTLVAIANDQKDTEVFKKYKNMQSITYIFETDESLTLTLRVVVGEAIENATNTGFILSNSKGVSNEFSKKMTLKKSWFFYFIFFKDVNFLYWHTIIFVLECNNNLGGYYENFCYCINKTSIHCE